MGTVPTLYDFTRSSETAAPSHIVRIRQAVSAAQQRHGAPAPEAFHGLDPVGTADEALTVIEEGEREIARAEALLPAAEARRGQTARARNGWWFLLGAMALGGIVILIGQQVF